MTKAEQDEVLALGWAGVPEVPAEAAPKGPVWIYALAKVWLRSMRESWVIVRNDYGRAPVVIRTFCDSSIASVLSIHPYKFLDDRYVPKLQDAAAVKRYIAGAYGVPLESVSALKKAELLRLLYSHCIKVQLQDEKQNKE